MSLSLVAKRRRDRVASHTHLSALSAILLASLLPVANAFSFNIDNLPQQCSDMSISITGSDGVPPYRVLIIPFGGSPLENNVEARRILDHSFDGDSTSISFQLPYPALSQFVAVVSDSQNFGSGGTSSAAAVANSSDTSCFNSSQSVQVDFFFNIDPLNQFVQCQQSRIWWDASTVQGQPTFYGIIPGGNSFNITMSDLTTVQDQGLGFNWIPNIRGGTTLIVGAGDNRGLGAGGSVTYIVSNSANSSCLDSSAPSSTPGSPAGGSYPTSTSEAENVRNDDGGSNTGAIAGGIVAAVVVICAFILVLLFLRRRKRQSRSTKERPDLFTDNEHPSNAQDGENARLAPEPYIVSSDPTSEWGGSSAFGTGTGVPGSAYGYGTGASAAGAGAGSSHPLYDRPMSGYSLSTHTGTEGDWLRPGTPQTATTSAAGTSASGNRKGPMPVLRPVNIIQHEDAGTTIADDSVDGEAETVELPPAYTNIRRD